MSDGRPSLLLVEDEESLVHAFEKLARRHHIHLSVARTGQEAFEFLKGDKIDVAMLDVNMNGHSGIEILDFIKKNSLATEAIMMTGGVSVENAVASLKMGAYDYLLKPFDDLERIAILIEKAREKAELVRQLKRVETKNFDEEGFGLLIGRSPKMQEIYHLIQNVAPSNSAILVVGESGTGKELVARAIHDRSLRRSKPFVVVNCSAIPEALLESELFGHVKGSFTGAIQDKKGLFEEADGGTLFLDEIGEIPQSVQVKLLRVLQDGEIRRVGGNQNIHTDVRIISATNRDLTQMIKEELFREDLFYRLNVITLHLPPLEEKKEDIPHLAYHFLRKYAAKTERKIREISLDALQALQAYSWPGNVRELENVIERALVLAKGEKLTAHDLPAKMLGEVFYSPVEEVEEMTNLPYHKAKDRALRMFNRSYISHLLQSTDGNISQASDKAGMDRSNFKKIIKKCQLGTEEFKKNRGNS